MVETLLLWWRTRIGSTTPGFFLLLSLHFLSRDKKTKQKKTPVPRFILRVVAVAGARGNSLSLRQSAHFIPPTPPMLGAGQWEI